MVSENVVILHGDVSTPGKDSPFDLSECLGRSYAHLVKCFQEEGHQTYIASPHSYEYGMVGMAWSLVDNQWQPFSNIKTDIVYNRFRTNYQSNLPRLTETMTQMGTRIVNSSRLDDICTDKLLTSQELGELSIPTYLLDHDVHNLSDLANRRVMEKPRFGKRSIGVKRIDNFTIDESLFKKDYIIQPFVETSTGVPALKVEGRHDLRVIMVNNEPSYVEVRVFSDVMPEGYPLPIHRFAMDPANLPENFLNAALAVDRKLEKHGTRIYSVDMGMDKEGRVWVFELNSRPGMFYDLNPEKEKSILHEKIASAFSQLVLGKQAA